MQTTVDEIAPDVFRLSTFVPDVGPTGFTFNQFLVRDDEPFLFHTGMRQLFPLVSEAIGRVLPVESLRWISFAHVEADECGAMNAVPRRRARRAGRARRARLHGVAERPRRPTAAPDGRRRGARDRPAPPAVRRRRRTSRTTGRAGCGSTRRPRTLFAGDLFTALGDGPALVTEGIVDAAMTGEEVFHATSIGAATVPTLRRLADLGPTTLATMHGSSYSGDGAGQLLELADAYTAMVAAAV